jgi:hypothetical protein
VQVGEKYIRTFGFALGHASELFSIFENTYDKRRAFAHHVVTLGREFGGTQEVIQMASDGSPCI